MKDKVPKLKDYYIKDIKVCGGCGSQGGSHADCYKKFCSYCGIFFKSKEENKDHALKYHKDNWCQKCNQSIRCIKKHQENYHAS